MKGPRCRTYFTIRLREHIKHTRRCILSMVTSFDYMSRLV